MRSQQQHQMLRLSSRRPFLQVVDDLLVVLPEFFTTRALESHHCHLLYSLLDLCVQLRVRDTERPAEQWDSPTLRETYVRAYAITMM